MSTEPVDRQQQEIKNFMTLLPLTLEIAGLPQIEVGRHLNEGQMEVRATLLRAGYKIAKKLVRDIAKESVQPPASGA